MNDKSTLCLLAIGEADPENLPEGDLAVFAGSPEAISVIAKLFRRPVSAYTLLAAEEMLSALQVVLSSPGWLELTESDRSTVIAAIKKAGSK